MLEEEEEETDLENRWFNILKFQVIGIRISNKSKELSSKYRRTGSKYQLMSFE